jgi:hypothetical protein
MITKQIIEELTAEFNEEIKIWDLQTILNYACDGYISRAIRQNYVSKPNPEQNEVQKEETV